MNRSVGSRSDLYSLGMIFYDPGSNGATIGDPTGEPDKGGLRLDFDRRLLLQFRGSKITFLDDLQWLDAATFDVLEDLLTHPDVRHLLLVGAYRDNDVNAVHPLMRKLDAAVTLARS